MNCKAVQTKLSAYLDRELPGEELMAIRTHLHDCSSCHAEEQALRSLKSILCSARTPEPPADLAERLTAAVFADRQPAPEPRGFRIPAFTFAGVAVCSMALTFIVLTAVRPPDSSPSATGPKDSSTGVAFEVQRDQAFLVGADATSGVPLMSAAGYGGR